MAYANRGYLQKWVAKKANSKTDHHCLGAPGVFMPVEGMDGRKPPTL